MNPEVFIEYLADTIQLEMILIEGGEMKIQGKYEKTSTFYLGKCPITQEFIQKLMT